MMNFNPKWIYKGRFCDGHFQGVKVDKQSIECARDEARFAASADAVGRMPTYWTPEVIREMESQAIQAMAQAA